MTKRRLIEAAIVAALFVAAAAWSTGYWKQSFRAGRQPVFYQLYFEPAVMIACGHGFLRANPPVPAVTDFLLQKRDAIACTDIPASTRLTDRGLYQKAWIYLMLTVGLAWRVLGISWSGLAPLFGVLFGATIVAAYGIFRTGMGRVAASLGAVALGVSSVHLQNLPHLRDYAKAPFTLALIFFAFALVSGPLTWRRSLVLSAAYGVVLGIGYGFRTDFLIDIPLFTIVLLVFAGGGLLKDIPVKLAAGTVCAAAFVLTAWPVIRSVQQGGGCQWHAVLLGLTDGPTEALMVTKAPYDFGHDFSDDYVYSVATAYAARTQPGVPHIEYCSHDYDVFTGRYAVDIAKTFPGDLFTRTIASVVQVLQLPFRWFDQPLPGFASTLYRARLVVLKPLRGSGVVFMTAALVALAAVSPRLGLFGVFFLFYVGGYPMLQFDVRHYFHLEFMTWWAIGFLAHHLVREWRASTTRTWRAAVERIRAGYDWTRGLRTIGAAAAGVVIAMWIGRGLQQASATRLFQQYVDAPKTAVDVGRRDAGVLHRIRAYHSPAADPYPADLLEVDVNADRCPGPPSVTFLYDRPYDTFAHTSTIEAPAAGSEPTRIFAPVYAGFAGLRFAGTTPDCVKGVYRVSDPGRLHLLLGAELPPSWRRHAMFQQLEPLRWRR